MNGAESKLARYIAKTSVVPMRRLVCNMHWRRVSRCRGSRGHAYCRRDAHGIDGSYHQAFGGLLDETDTRQWFWLFEIFWCMSVIPVKLSISCMLGRIAVAKRPYMIVLYVMSGLLTFMTLLGMFYIAFRCTPVS